MANETTQTTDLLSSVLSELALVVDAIDQDRLQDPTPCGEWDVAQLRDHVLGWLVTFAAGFSDPEGRAPNADIANYSTPSDGGAEVRRAAESLVGALRGGAAQRPLWLGENSMPGELALGMILWEYQVHGWDLARATGQEWSPPVAAAEESLAFAPAMLTPDYQGEGKAFAPPVVIPGSSSALDQLLGLSGRDPEWTAP